MRRLMLVIPVVVAFAAGWTLASGRAPVAEARPKPTCKDDLAKARRENAALSAENAKMKVAMEQFLVREKKRVEMLEEQIGNNEPIRDLK
jgi:hypothetical protein